MTPRAWGGAVAATVVALALGVVVGFALDDGDGGGDAGADLAAGAGSTTTSSPASGSSTTETTVGATTTAAPSTTEPERLTEASTIDVRGVGPIEAGMTLREAERVGGRPIRVTEFDTFDGRCYYAEPEGLPGLGFLVLAPGDAAPADPRDGVIGRVTADGGSWRTVSGARVGSSIDEVRRRYPEHLRDTPHEYQEGGRYLTFEPQTARDRPYGVRFEIADGRTVDLIHSGRADVITFVEGCA